MQSHDSSMDQAIIDLKFLIDVLRECEQPLRMSLLGEKYKKALNIQFKSALFGDITKAIRLLSNVFLLSGHGGTLSVALHATAAATMVTDEQIAEMAQQLRSQMQPQADTSTSSNISTSASVVGKSDPQLNPLNKLDAASRQFVEFVSGKRLVKGELSDIGSQFKMQHGKTLKELFCNKDPVKKLQSYPDFFKITAGKSGNNKFEFQPALLTAINFAKNKAAKPESSTPHKLNSAYTADLPPAMNTTAMPQAFDAPGPSSIPLHDSDSRTAPARPSYNRVAVQNESKQGSLVESKEDFLASFYDKSTYAPSSASSAANTNQIILADRTNAQEYFNDCALLGRLISDETNENDEGEEDEGDIDDLDTKRVTDSEADPSSELYLNTNESFCCVCVGVQGSGKSHTTGVIIENCMIPVNNTPPGHQAGPSLINLKKPMTTLVLHFDESELNVCEITGIVQSAHNGLSLPKEDMIVLVSPDFHHQRKEFYGENFTIKPLLFEWASLNAEHLKKLIHVDSTGGSQPLYVSVLLSKLREYQRENGIPPFEKFVEEILEACQLPGQKEAFTQRMDLLRHFIKETDLNKNLRKEGADLTDILAPGKLVIVDLTERLLDQTDVNGLFQVLVEKFRSFAISQEGKKCSKLLVLDEAHKYMRADKNDGLGKSLVLGARMMRHDGIRLLLSTQSPHTLPPELLELVSIAFLHQFHSPDWFKYLSMKLPLHDSMFERIQRLEAGEAFVYARKIKIDRLEQRKNERVRGVTKELGASSSSFCKNTLCVKVRPRLTADRGASRTNDDDE